MSAIIGVIGQGWLGFVQRFVQRPSPGTAPTLDGSSRARAHLPRSLSYRQRSDPARRQLNDKPAALLLDTGANNSIVDVRSAGFDGLKLDALQSTGKAGAEGASAVREVKLSLEHRSWLNRRVSVMNLWNGSGRMGVRVDGFIGSDVLSEFAAVRMDYKAGLVEFEQ